MTTTIIEGILALVFASSGTIVYLFKDKLRNRLSWLTDYSPRMVLFICISKVLGALGLIVPAVYLHDFPILTLIAAFGLAVIMLLAAAYHLRKKEYKDLPATLILLTLCLIVVYNRF